MPNKSRKRNIPERWTSYKNVGRPIVGTRLLAFKVPLTEASCERLRPHVRFTPADLLRSMRDSALHLGLVIDLTNTTRYYNPQEFTKAGIEYHKLHTRGHVIPHKNIVQSFNTVVQDFLSQHSDDDLVIGVHCTHGVNRTGYLICRYLIECLGWTAARAQAEFGKARGHEVERSNYTADLQALSEARQASDSPSGRGMQIDELSTQSPAASERGVCSSSHYAINLKGHDYRSPQGINWGNKISKCKDQHRHQPYSISDSKTHQYQKGHHPKSNVEGRKDNPRVRNGPQCEGCDISVASHHLLVEQVCEMSVKNRNLETRNTAYHNQWHYNSTSNMDQKSSNKGFKNNQPTKTKKYNSTSPAYWESRRGQSAWSSFHGYQSFRLYNHHSHTLMSKKRKNRSKRMTCK